MNHQEVNALIQAIHVLWPTVPFQADYGPDMIRVWQLVLNDVPLRAAETIVVDLARSGDRFPPTPGVIAQAVLALRSTIEGTGAPGADEAWQMVAEAVRARGWYRGIPAADSWHPAVDAAARAIGWDELCHGDVMVTRAHFMRLYPEAARRVETGKRQAATFAALGIESTRFALPEG